jgi:hypothetical protein
MENFPQDADARREKETIVLDDGAQLPFERLGLFII